MHSPTYKGGTFGVIILILFLMLSIKTMDSKCPYLWPLIPLIIKALGNMSIRKKLWIKNHSSIISLMFQKNLVLMQFWDLDEVFIQYIWNSEIIILLLCLFPIACRRVSFKKSCWAIRQNITITHVENYAAFCSISFTVPYAVGLIWPLQLSV